MTRYDHNTSLLFCLLCFFICYPMGLSQLSSTQRTTMANLSKLFNGTVPWDINKDSNPCLWKGVMCSPNRSSVVGLSLSGFSLSSSVFLRYVCEIDSLQNLDVSNNRLTLIPNEFITLCGKIGELKSLNFSKNRLVGPLPEFVGFVGLEVLDLSYNHMNGNITLELEGLVGIRSLNLSFNNFRSSFPKLGKSKALEELVFSVNNFTDIIPEELAGHLDLRLIDFSQNNLTGSVPDRIGELPRLEVLILSSNWLSGEIPQTVSNLTTLLRFAANQNQLSGVIPSGITKFLKNLDLSYNHLTGSIPSDLMSPLNLQTLDLSYNKLEGPIPANLSLNLVRLRLGNNSLDGFIPATFGRLQKLMYLELDNNNLTGLIPPELGSCRFLALLNLAHNRLIGSFPAQFGSLRNLQVLKLQFNELNGGIPMNITQMQNLSVLNISWNSMNGPIPSSISSLQLINMNLQGNNFNGSIPATIGSMNSLLELQLGLNKLSGNIPKMPPNLQIALNLSSNLFEGPIPDTLDGLTGLEVLDLSNNKFTGQVPTFLTRLPSLSRLVLSNNYLFGVIPEFNPLIEVDIGGNPNLRNDTKSNTPVSSTKKGKSNTVIIAVTVAVAVAGLVVGAVTVTAILLSQRYYRISDGQQQSREDLPLPEVVQSSLLTTNAIHRSNIDFIKAMEEVSNPSNIVLKTRFSTYYKATMPSGSSYFVKKLNWTDKIFQLGSHDRFGEELECFGKLSNSNVMTPLAYVLTVDSAYLFYEFVPKGAMFDVLHKNLRSELDWASRYSIAIGVAQGLAFLHGSTSGSIILLDLSSKNIFLKSLKEPQVGDIELHKVIDPTKSTGSLSTVAGSVGYIPPEYAYTMRITMAGNVYSFGVILLELLTGKPAVNEGTELAKWVLSNTTQQDKWEHILDARISRTSLAVKSQMLAALKVALGCVGISPEARPKMKSVLRMLLNAR